MEIPDIVIYHSPCQDGFTAAWVCWKKWTGAPEYAPGEIPDIQYVPGVHGQPPPDVTGKNVLIVDFSYKRPVLEQMAKQAKSITVFDHHISAQKDLQPLLDDGTIKGVFDMSRSGALITLNELFPESLKPSSFTFMQAMCLLVDYVSDRDLWKFELPYSREVSAALFSYDYTWDNWSRFQINLNAHAADRIIPIGQALLRKHDHDIKELLEQCTSTASIGNFMVPVANLPYTMASDAANILSQGKPFGATYFIDKDGNYKFSLRSSEGGEDVSVIASSYGGGGHAQASGFSRKASQIHIDAQGNLLT